MTLLVKGEDRGRQSASVQLLCECGHCIVCRDKESLPRSEWHGGSFLWVGACVFITQTPQKTKVGVVF